MILMNVKRVGGMNVKGHQRWVRNMFERVQNKSPGHEVINMSWWCNGDEGMKSLVTMVEYDDVMGDVRSLGRRAMVGGKIRHERWWAQASGVARYEWWWGIEWTLDGGKKGWTEGSVQGIDGKHISRVDMRLIPIKPFYHFTIRSNTLPLMSIRNAASTDNSVGSRAVYVAPDNRGEITRCDNCVEDSCVNQSCGCGNFSDSI